MRTIYFDNGKVVMIDQTKLPSKLEMRQCEDVQCLIEAIKTLRVRGAPALGVAGAYAIVLSAQAHINDDDEAFIDGVNRDAMRVAASRPTAVNLGWGVESQMRIISMRPKKEEALRLLVENAERIAEMDIENNRRIGKYGSSLIENGDGILTHCNAGALACVDYGTALGVIRSAHEDGKRIHVYVDETRPLCQGSRLTAWEMENESIPATLITDSMAGFLMARGNVQKVVVGADRIAANGDTANKIGTYSLSVLARHHDIPLIIAAPTSTIDFGMADGAEIPIEERDGDEIRIWNGAQNAPEGIDVYNPAFDVTPAENISAIVTEKGIARAPYSESLKAFKP